MDMRQKLLPIFIAEAEKNLKLLKRFLLQGAVLIGDPEELESAFRAAHTLKGTSKLVEADAIHRISRRLEAMLEKHFSNQTSLAPVECEAMQLAIDWLSQGLDALKGQQPEAKTLVDEALNALDLAERFPDVPRLVDLLDNALQWNDPFAEDPNPLPDSENIPIENDPFADDPDFGLELDTSSGRFEVAEGEGRRDESKAPSGEPVDDPFADDPQLEIVGDLESAEQSVPDFFAEDPAPLLEPSIDSAAEPVFDPFAGDPALLDEEERDSPRDAEEPYSDQESEPFDEAGSAIEFSGEEPQSGAEAPAAEVAPAAVVEDPFADDPDLDMSIEREPIGSVKPAAESSEPNSSVVPSLGEQQDIADRFLLAGDNEQPRRVYVACTFELGSHAYYLPIEQMREIAELPAVVPLPLAPPLVSGLINLRGRVMPVIDLSVLHPGTTQTDTVHRLVVGEYQGEQVAFLAEGIPRLSEEVAGEKIDLAEFLAKYQLSGVEE